MIIVEPGSGNFTHQIRYALSKVAPDLARHGGPTYADVSIVARRYMSQAGWFDLYHSYETFTDEEWADSPVTHVHVAHIGVLPPPPAIPVETRIAALPEPTLDGWDQEKIDVMGGETHVLDVLRHRQRRAVERDTSADAYDWDTAAETWAGILRDLPDRKLTAEERVKVAEVREWRALNEVANARKSLRHLRTNAGLAEVPEQDGPGRPAIGPQVPVSLSEDDIAALDRMRERTRASRSSHLREAARLYLRVPEGVSDLPTRYGHPTQPEESPAE